MINDEWHVLEFASSRRYTRWSHLAIPIARRLLLFRWGGVVGARQHGMFLDDRHRGPLLCVRWHNEPGLSGFQSIRRNRASALCRAGATLAAVLTAAENCDHFLKT